MTFRTKKRNCGISKWTNTHRIQIECGLYTMGHRVAKRNLCLNVLGLLGSIVDLLGGKETTEDGSGHTNVIDLLVGLQGLDALLLLRDDLGAGVHGHLELHMRSGLAGGDNEDREGDGSLFLTLGSVELELTLESVVGGLLDLEQGDGGEANWGVNADIGLEDLDEEVVVALLVVGIKGEVLLVLGVAACVLLNGGLLVAILIGEVGGQLDIGIVLAHVLVGEEREGLEGKETRSVRICLSFVQRVWKVKVEGVKGKCGSGDRRQGGMDTYLDVVQALNAVDNDLNGLGHGG